jgi:2-phosphoglycerate kinase
MEPTCPAVSTILIVIFGVPGTGKSTAASHLSVCLDGTLVISTDIVRTFAVSHGLESSKWLNRTSHDAWQLFGEKTIEHIVSGFRLHSEAVLSFVDPILKELFQKHRIVILEGVHMTEETLQRYEGLADMLLPIYVGIDESYHGRRLEKKTSSRIQADNVWQRNYDVLQTIDNYFKQLKTRNKIDIYPRDEKDLQILVDRLQKEMEGSCSRIMTI